MIFEYDGKTPRIGENVYIAPTATIIGDVEIEDGASIWFGAVLRGDNALIRLGTDSNIQDNCTIHTDKGFPTVIGKRVSIGHNAIVHGCEIEDDCLIAMGVVILNGAFIKKGSLVAAQSLIKEKQEVGPYQLVAGIPAQVKKFFMQDKPDEMILKAAEAYTLKSKFYGEKCKLVK